MATTPEELNDAQARHAVQLFYDAMPDSAWIDDKPSIERVNTVVRTLTETADPQSARTLASLTDDSNIASQAAVARILLHQALATPALADTARTAIAGASRANMMIDATSGLLIIGMLLATTSYTKNADGSVHVELAGGVAGILSAMRVPDILDKLPAVIKALPAAVVSKLAGL